MTSGAAHARELASGVLADLGLVADGWHVIDVVEAESLVEPPRDGVKSATHLLITVGGPFDTFQAHFTEGVDHKQAEIATAGQLQDHAIELLGGAAVPPCPGHPHPLEPAVVDGEPVWTCPHDPAHHRFPVSGAR